MVLPGDRTDRRSSNVPRWARTYGCTDRTSRLLSAPAVAGQSAAAAAGERARLDGPGEELYEPGVDGDPVQTRRRLEPRLQALRQAERDPRGKRLVEWLGGARRLVADEHELGVAACETDFDASVVELVRELERRLAERLEQPPAEGRLERDREHLRRAGGGLVADRCDARDVVAECLDIAVELHGGSMTSL